MTLAAMAALYRFMPLTQLLTAPYIHVGWVVRRLQARCAALAV